MDLKLLIIFASINLVTIPLQYLLVCPNREMVSLNNVEDGSTAEIPGFTSLHEDKIYANVCDVLC